MSKKKITKRHILNELSWVLKWIANDDWLSAKRVLSILGRELNEVK